MCYVLKYGIWNISEPGMEAVNALTNGGYPPLAAMILSSRKMQSVQQAQRYLCCDAPLQDPFLLTDMHKAVAAVKEALSHGDKIAVFGDYDVDGVTATCLLTDFICGQGGACVPYIPGRLEEGYGLNKIAIDRLAAEGVKLIITVDCGITAMEEALLCRQLGITLVITDHHECKAVLPEAAAIVDPHRADCTYPHKGLSGVGVAFKLAAALCGSQHDILDTYADMVCLGTVADVMPLCGENRVFVSRGLESLRRTKRPGLAALIRQSGCEMESMNASSVGYILAPRINAAGRMGQIDLAVELLLTHDEMRAEELAAALCELNRERQSVEAEIYQQVVSMLPRQTPDAIVLADSRWHQGVVGIVASRISEEYCCPTFLICIDGEHGKASSRSYGGFNLFASLTKLSSLLESYGGHELAAGFTISTDKIDQFREQICALAQQYYADDTPHTVLEADCVIPPEMLTVANIDSLECLEPCGNGCPKPVLVAKQMTIERISVVGNGRHMRLRLRNGKRVTQAIYFSATPKSASVTEGEIVDIAFLPQVNEYRGERTVQMNILDIRPSCTEECSADIAGYRALCAGTLTAAAAEQLLPDRNTLGMVWRYLASCPQEVIEETPMCLCRKIVRWSGCAFSLGKLMVCLDIFADVGLLEVSRYHQYITIRLSSQQQKADLNESRTMQQLVSAKES